MENYLLTDRVIFGKSLEERALFRVARKGNLMLYDNVWYEILDCYRTMAGLIVRKIEGQE